MLFLNPFLLLGLAGIAIPVIIHLFNRRNAREVSWGAMRFLLDSLMSRRRSLLMEEMLLLAARCLLAGCAVLALARPFVPAGSAFPWWLVLPLGLLGIVFFGMSFALGRNRGWQVLAWLACLLCFALSAAAILLEKRLSLNRFVGGTARDIALVIDGSSSMTLSVDGETNFSRALKEAARLIEEAPRGVAFSVIVAGAVPDPLVPAPVTDRKYVLAALEQAIPVQGVLRVPDALAAAAASLAQGSHPAQQIILIGDGQAIGWQTGDLESWSYLAEAFERLPSKPRVFVRTLELPQGIRNLTLKSVAFSRPVVGTDRDVRVDVTLANTGREAVTPAHVALRVAGKEKVDRSVGQMEPGAERVVSFLHRFDAPGAQVVEARLAADDEMASDDSMQRVIQIMRTLKVLVVDDGRAVRLLDRPGGYVALGLMPSSKELQERGAKARDSGRPRFLMEPELTPRERAWAQAHAGRLCGGGVGGRAVAARGAGGAARGFRAARRKPACGSRVALGSRFLQRLAERGRARAASSDRRVRGGCARERRAGGEDRFRNVSAPCACAVPRVGRPGGRGGRVLPSGAGDQWRVGRGGAVAERRGLHGGAGAGQRPRGAALCAARPHGGQPGGAAVLPAADSRGDLVSGAAGDRDVEHPAFARCGGAAVLACADADERQRVVCRVFQEGQFQEGSAVAHRPHAGHDMERERPGRGGASRPLLRALDRLFCAEAERRVYLLRERRRPADAADRLAGGARKAAGPGS
jgi:hypothetical protein